MASKVIYDDKDEDFHDDEDFHEELDDHDDFQKLALGSSSEPGDGKLCRSDNLTCGHVGNECKEDAKDAKEEERMPSRKDDAKDPTSLTPPQPTSPYLTPPHPLLSCSRLQSCGQKHTYI